MIHKTTLSILLLIHLLHVTNPDNEFLEQWFSALSNPAEECSSLGSTLATRNNNDEKDDNTIPVFEVAKDCSEVDARWDYNFLSHVKPRKGGVFDSPGKIVLPLKVIRDFRPEHNNYKFGFRNNKCLRLYSDEVSSIQGNFVQDRLEGRVRIDFHTGGFVVGFARKSRLVGPVRFFDSKSKLLNVTVYRNNEVDVSVSKTEYDMYRLSTRESRKTHQAYYTKDFSTVYRCEEEEEEYLLRNCYEATKIKADIKECDIEIFEQGAKEEGRGDKGEVFDWNIRFDERLTKGQEPYHDCSGEWSSEDTRNRLKLWLFKMQDHTSDPFWSEEPAEDPVREEDHPTIAFTFPEYLGRILVKGNSGLNVTTMDGKDLGVEALYNAGDVKIDLSASDLANHNWARLLRFTVDLRGTSGIQYNMGDVNEFVNIGTVARLRRGRLHGVVRRYGQFITDEAHACGKRFFNGLSFVGRYEDGVPVGYAWRGVIGDGFIYGRPDASGQMTGDDIAFVYQDLRTAMIGRFRNGIMEEGRKAEVIATRCVRGMMELKFSEPSGPVFLHSIPTNSSFGSQPMLVDPLDETYIEVRESDVEHHNADEGVFAKEDIPANTVVALYGGMFFKDDEIERFNRAELARLREEYPDKGDWTVTKYHAGVTECKFVITFPHHLASTADYRATKAHKFNHSFRPNCEYGGRLDSPRFGLVRAFYTNRDIKKGEELFISYGYPLSSSPPWYEELYEKTKEEFGDSGFSERAMSRLFPEKQLEEKQMEEKNKKNQEEEVKEEEEEKTVLTEEEAAEEEEAAAMEEAAAGAEEEEQQQIKG